MTTRLSGSRPLARFRRLVMVSAVASLMGLLAGPAGAEPAPSQVQRLAASVTAITAGGGHTCAVLATGAVRCWGYGRSGQLGHDSTASIGDGAGTDPSIQAAGDVPVGGPATAIAAGFQHTCAVLTTGGVRCWGLGRSGRLGHDSTASIGDGAGLSIRAAGNVPLGGKATAIAAGGRHTCALLTTGAVRCWGRGRFGQLGHNSRAAIGNGTGLSIRAAGNVPLGGKATAIAAGGSHTCALLTTGAVRCWGVGRDGMLGHNNRAGIGNGDGKSIKAAGNVPLGGKATAIAAGRLHTCALLTTGAVRCWGNGHAGQLGHNSTHNIGDGTGKSIKAAGNVPLGAKAVSISAGYRHTCAVLTTGAVRCWGAGMHGELGHNSTHNIGDGFGKSIKAAGNVPVGGTSASITTGAGDTTCAVLTTRAVRCWGFGGLGALGHDNTIDIGAGGTTPSIKAAGDVPV